MRHRADDDRDAELRRRAVRRWPPRRDGTIPASRPAPAPPACATCGRTASWRCRSATRRGRRAAAARWSRVARRLRRMVVSALGGTDQVAPDVVRQFCPGGGDELVQALEIAAGFMQMAGFVGHVSLRPLGLLTAASGDRRSACARGAQHHSADPPARAAARFQHSVSFGCGSHGPRRGEHLPCSVRTVGDQTVYTPADQPGHVVGCIHRPRNHQKSKQVRLIHVVLRQVAVVRCPHGAALGRDGTWDRTAEIGRVWAAPPHRCVA